MKKVVVPSGDRQVSFVGKCVAFDGVSTYYVTENGGIVVSVDNIRQDLLTYESTDDLLDVADEHDPDVLAAVFAELGTEYVEQLRI